MMTLLRLEVCLNHIHFQVTQHKKKHHLGRTVANQAARQQAAETQP